MSSQTVNQVTSVQFLQTVLLLRKCTKMDIWLLYQHFAHFHGLRMEMMVLHFNIIIIIAIITANCWYCC